MSRTIAGQSWPGAGAGSLVSIAVACFTFVTADAAQAATSGSLLLRATGTTGPVVTGAGQFAVDGDTTVNISVARLSGGNTTIVAGPGSALPRAVKFPAYVSSGTYPRAVVSLTPTSGAALSPGSSNFVYGAVFRLDAKSSGRTADNGDNLFQRGLYSNSSQLKLQVDSGYPSCLVKGSSGQVYVKSSTKLAADRWYRTTCSRVGSRLTVQVAPYGGTATSKSVTGSAGTLTFASTVRASIGGKLTSTGAVVSGSTDQFNGAVASAWIERVN